MTQRLIIFLFTALVLALPGQDRQTLLKRERQYILSLEATAARLLEEDDALKTLNRRIKAEQHQLYRRLQAHPKIQEIAPLKDTNPVIYRQRYLPQRRELLDADGELKELHDSIRRLQGELARRLDRRPEIIAIRRLMEELEKELALIPDGPLF